MRLSLASTFFLMGFLMLTALSFGQRTRIQLERDKTNNRSKIEKASKILEETKEKKEASVGQLQALQEKIRRQQDLVNTLQKEADLVGNQLDRVSGITTSLEGDMRDLKNEYAEMIYQASKISYYDRMLFIFSSSSINELLLRLKYLENYSAVRREQIEVIIELKEELEVREASLRKLAEEKKKVLEENTREKNKLQSLIANKNTLVNQLNRQESRLRREIERRRNQMNRLEELIAEQLKKEAEMSAEVKTQLDASGVELSEKFKGSKKRLPWPIPSGFISGKYGKQPHPVLKNITVENLGIDIQTGQGETVRTVFQGEVSLITNIPGKGYVVFVQHGEYYTVYANMDQVMVDKGKTVKQGDPIGKVATGSDGTTELQFQVWRNNKHLNPEDWLKKQ